jgi:hypothetical protein
MPHAVTGRDKPRGPQATKRRSDAATKGSPPLTAAERRQVLDGMSPAKPSRVRDAHGQEWTPGPGAPIPHLDDPETRQARVQEDLPPVALRHSPGFGEPDHCPACDGMFAQADFLRRIDTRATGPTQRDVFAHCQHCDRTWSVRQVLFNGRWLDGGDVELRTRDNTPAEVLANVKLLIERKRGVIHAA